MSEDDSEAEKKKKKRLEGTGGLLGGGVLPEDDENRWSPTAVVTSVDIQCPMCNGHFSSDSAYRNHLPCRG